jgi:hypothetical protein
VFGKKVSLRTTSLRDVVKKVSLRTTSLRDVVKK